MIHCLVHSTWAVRQILCKNGVLADASCPDATMAKAMATYMRNRGLHEMETFNGRVWQVLQHHEQAKDPNHAGIISFKR